MAAAGRRRAPYRWTDTLLRLYLSSPRNNELVYALQPWSRRQTCSPLRKQPTTSKIL